MGDYDTMTTPFLMDTALYYLAAVIPVYRWSSERLGIPPYYQDGSEIAFYPMRFYNRRLVAIAKRKKALGIYGNHNAGRRPGFVGFSVRGASWVMLGARPPPLGEGRARERLVLSRQAGARRRAGPEPAAEAATTFRRPCLRSRSRLGGQRLTS